MSQRIVREQWGYIEDIGQMTLIARQTLVVDKLAQIIKEPVLPFELSDLEATLVRKLANVTDEAHNKRLTELLQLIREHNERTNTKFERLKYAPALPVRPQQ